MAVRTETPTYPVPWTSGRVASWVTTVDHKRIGILYIWTSLVFFLVGGGMAELMRTQLATPNEDFIVRNSYNELLTMHGTVMVFLVVVPVWAGFANFLIPLMIGARDMAFPRLNAFSYWMFLLGGIVLLVELLRDRRRRAHGLVRLPAALRAGARATARTSGSSACTSSRSRRSRRDQLRRDDPQHAHRRA